MAYGPTHVFFGQANTRFVGVDVAGLPLSEVVEFKPPERDYAIELGLEVLTDGNWIGKIIDKAPGDVILVDEGADSTPDTVRMDPRLMELALSNLLVNASKYGRRKVLLGAVQVGSDYALTVEDDGQGVPVDERETVFKAFTRLDDSRNRETGGYGLGLAVVALVAGRFDGPTE